jgi:O-methyltransferase
VFYGIDGSANFERFVASLAAIRNIFGSVYASDDLIAIRRNVGFLTDDRLNRAVQAGLSPISDTYLRDQSESKMWRLHTLTWAAYNAAKLTGDFVECGVFNGFSAAVVCEYLDFRSQDRTFYLYDSFAGLSSKYSTEAELTKNEFFDRHPDVYQQCLSRFGSYTNVRVIKGVLPDVLDETAPQRVAFLHLDLNCAAAERATLAFFLDRVVAGGIVVLDDYGKAVFRNQKDAADEVASSHGEAILELPTGQGLLLKSRS